MSELTFTPSVPELLRVVDDLLWLGNNLHNYGSPQFRQFLEAAIEDARRAKGLPPKGDPT